MGAANFAVDMADTSERLKESGLQVDVLELAAETGATVVGYRVTNDQEKRLQRLWPTVTRLRRVTLGYAETILST